MTTVMQIVTRIFKSRIFYFVLFVVLLLTLVFSIKAIVADEFKGRSLLNTSKQYIDDEIINSSIDYPNEAGKKFHIKKDINDNYLDLVLSKNDTYKIEFYNNYKSIDYIIVSTKVYINDENDDGYSLLYFVPDHICEKQYDSIGVYPINGDGIYHVYSIKTINDPNIGDYNVDVLVDYQIDKIEINISEDDFEKISQDRRRAIELNVLISDGIYMPADVYVDGEKFKTELRLKSDWTDHIEGSKWSYRIKVRGACIWGMSEFSIQTPASRSGIGEYLIHEFYRKQGGVALRYSFVDVIINGSYMGVYAVEEGFTKRAVENSLKREGVIIKPNEDLVWESRAFYHSNTKNMINKSDFTSFSIGKTTSDEKLANYAKYAINNLNKYFSEKSISMDEVFDMEMYAIYLAFLDMFGSSHGTYWHNKRYYFNPVTAKLEPITFDEQIYSDKELCMNYEESVVKLLGNNEQLKRLYFDKLYFIAEIFDDFIIDEQQNIDRFNYILKRDGFPYLNLDKAYLINQEVKESKNNQGVEFNYKQKEGNVYKLLIGNKNLFDVSVEKIWINEQLLTLSNESTLLSEDDNTVNCCL